MFVWKRDDLTGIVGCQLVCQLVLVKVVRVTICFNCLSTDLMLSAMLMAI